MKISFVICVLMSGILFIPETWAEEPHPATEHDYAGSIYRSGNVITLKEAIDRAVKASPRLLSSQARVTAAQGSEEQAGYWQNPEVEFEAENVAGGGPYRGTDSGEFTYGISQIIEIGGKRTARKSAAQAAREAASTELLAEQLNLARDVRVTYSELLAEEESVKLAIEQEELAKDVMNTVIDRVNAAAEPEIQFAKAEVAYTTSNIAREQAERQLSIAKEKLLLLWDKETLDGVLDHAYFYDLKAPTPLQTYQHQLDNLPDIRRFAHVIAEKSSALDLEEAQNTPDPSVNLGLRDFRENNEQALVLGISIPIPVLNQNQGNIARARAEMNEAESEKRQAELVLKQELNENWHLWNSTYREAEHLKSKLIPTAEKAFKLAREWYDKGKFPYLEVLDAQRTLFDARAQYHDALKRYHMARANVERLTTTNYEISGE